MIQTAFLGDVVLTTPLLEVLAQRHGAVDIVTTPAAAPLVETLPAVRRVVRYDKHGKDRGLPGLVGLARRLRAEHYDVAYLPHRSLRTAALAWLARIPTRIGYCDGWALFYTEARPRPRAAHEIDRLLALAAAQPRSERPSLHPTTADRATTEEFLRAHGFSGGEPFVALAPGSIWGAKRWPHYRELSEQLAARARLVVVGGPEDADLGDEIVRAVAGGGGRGGRGGPSSAVNACGRLTLRQSADVIRRAAVLVTNDSAPLHFAQAVGTPTVAIFGPTVPAFGFGPRGPRDRVVERGGLACRPCSPHGPETCPLGHHLCMRSLTVDQVLGAIEETGALHRRD